jgi:hypothetical protein
MRLSLQSLPYFLGREQNAQRIVSIIIAGFDFKCNYLDGDSPNFPVLNLDSGLIPYLAA